MFWASAFFKIVYIEKIESGKRYWLDINSYFSLNNLMTLKKSSFYNKFKKLVPDNFDDLTYDVQIQKILEISSSVKRETIRLIWNGEFQRVKFNINRNLFYVDSKNVNDKHFIFNEETGSLLPKNDLLLGLHLEDMKSYQTYENNTSSFTFGKINDGKFKKALPCLSKLTNVKFFEVESGLAVGLIFEDCLGKKTGVLYDAGTLSRHKIRYANLVIDYFDHESIEQFIFILSHEHYDHYSIVLSQIFQAWISKIDSSIFYYKDIDTHLKAQLVSKFKWKYPLKYENKSYNLGCVKIKTYSLQYPPVTSKTANETSILLFSNKTDELTLTGDQKYEKIPIDLIRLRRHFQVPHHGSEKSGNFKLANENEMNYIPNGKSWKLPKAKVVTHFEKNKKAKLL